MQSRSRSPRFKSLSCCFSIITIMLSSHPVLAGWKCISGEEPDSLCFCDGEVETGRMTTTCTRYGRDSDGNSHCIAANTTPEVVPQTRKCTAEEFATAYKIKPRRGGHMDGHGVLPGPTLTLPPREK
jgi:hypothetical protein